MSFLDSFLEGFSILFEPMRIFQQWFGFWPGTLFYLFGWFIGIGRLAQQLANRFHLFPERSEEPEKPT